jgi:hypothetical protein
VALEVAFSPPKELEAFVVYWFRKSVLVTNFDSNNFGTMCKMALPEIIQIIIKHDVYNDYMTHEHEHSHEDGRTHTHDHEKGEHHGREIEN